MRESKQGKDLIEISNRTRRLSCVRLACLAIAAPAAARAQATIPIVELPPASVRSVEQFGSIVNVRELPDGGLLVNDGARRQIKLLPAALTQGTVVKDSARTGANTWYGPRVLGLIPFTADSTLFPNIIVRTVTVLDPKGAIVRELAMPTPLDAAYLRRAAADDRGRILFGGEARIIAPSRGASPPVVSDSMPILRADLAMRTTDTVAFIARPLARADAIGATGVVQAYYNPDPLGTLDEWAVMTDGTLAIVRGHDYHIDFLHADGSKTSSPKLPFDWRPVGDGEKLKLIDSARTLRAISAQANTLINGVEKMVPWVDTRPGASAGLGAPGRPAFDTTNALHSHNNGGGVMTIINPPPTPVEKVFDYYPPIRTGSVFADFENHLWILPTTSKQSKAGELVYDVVNARGELFERVRAPLGRYIVGFGRNGVVYLATGSLSSGFAIERTQLPR
jgi:hypothetical protein